MDIRIEEPQMLDGRVLPVDCSVQISTLEQSHGHFRRLHSHDYIEILYGRGSAALVQVSDHVLTLDEGDLVIIHEGIGHDVITRGAPAEHHVIKFLPSLLQAPGEAPAEFRYVMPFWQSEDGVYAGFFEKRRVENSPIPRLIAEIMQESVAKPYGYELLIQSNLQRIVVELLRLSGAKEMRTEEITPALRHALEEVLSTARDHLADWTAERAAEAVFLSYPYFSRSFKRVYGIPFSSYMMALRFREAERLLLTTDENVSAIASRLGFATPAYFAECFRKRYGMPPRVFRDRYPNPK